MLAIAKQYEKEFQEKYIKTWYDIRYQYYRDSSGDRIPQLADNCYDRRDFVSLNEEGEVIGFISYFYNDVNMSASQFGAISFDIGNLIFVQDLIQVMGDIFFKFRLNRIEFMCFEDNPAAKGYRKLIKRFGGKEAGRFRKACRLMDGKLHNVIFFEVLREDLRWRKINSIIITPELAYQTGYGEQEQECIKPNEVIEDKEVINEKLQ